MRVRCLVPRPQIRLSHDGAPSTEVCSGTGCCTRIGSGMTADPGRNKPLSPELSAWARARSWRTPTVNCFRQMQVRLSKCCAAVEELCQLRERSDSWLENDSGVRWPKLSGGEGRRGGLGSFKSEITSHTHETRGQTTNGRRLPGAPATRLDRNKKPPGGTKPKQDLTGGTRADAPAAPKASIFLPAVPLMHCTQR